MAVVMAERQPMLGTIWFISSLDARWTTVLRATISPEGVALTADGWPTSARSTCVYAGGRDTLWYGVVSV